MSKQARSRQHRPSPRASAHPAEPASPPSFTPVPVRARHDGWTPARQVAFLNALSECACVEEAAAAVGMSARSAYVLKSRPDAASFRQAWDATLDFAVGRLADALVGRALHGEVTPVFYQGEQVGERRRYDNRLAMWILKHRQPDRYGQWRDRMEVTRDHPDGQAWLMAQGIGRVALDAQADEEGRSRTPQPPLRTMMLADDPAFIAMQEEAAQAREEAERERAFARFRATVATQAEERSRARPGAGPGDIAEDGAGGDAPRTS